MKRILLGLSACALLALVQGPASPGPDCNGNGVADSTDIALGTSSDCNGNGVPDECDTAVVFTTHVISTQAQFARSVWAADLDGDGDADVLSASQLDSKIAWYENQGAGSIGPQQVISSTASGARSVVAADLDGDLDIDVLAALPNASKVAWYENTDGAGTFGPEQVVSSTADGARAVFAADLDGDGDVDVMAALHDDNLLAWYENDGLGGFGPQATISRNAFQVQSVFAADLDGDLDLDALSAAIADDEVAWYENLDGAGAFSPQQTISTAADGAFSVFAADADGDGDADVFAASSNDNEVAWYENLDGLGGFGPQQVITSSALAALSVFAIDVDGDGDRDVLTASRDDDTVAWHENIDGLGGFGPRSVISSTASRAQAVFGIDLDGDLNVDVLSASLVDNKIAWYENESGDCNGNQVPDSCEVLVEDCNDNGLPDGCDMQVGQSLDCNDTTIPDECEIDGGISEDCTANGIPDECEPDCNENQAADSCDIAAGADDCDFNGVPDECEDCNGNGVGDACDIAAGADDCNANGIPDECEPDCNGNGVADGCDISGGTPDCNGNGVPDGCDIASSTSEDCTGNGVPDECEPDCNDNGEADSCDLELDLDSDCNANEVPDGCDTEVVFAEHSISIAAGSARMVVAADLDGDSDPDAVSASFDDDKIAWYENLGAGVFGPQQVVSTLANGAWPVSAADLDGDGDLDLLSGSQLGDEVAWYENTDGTGSFGTRQIISVADSQPLSVSAADLDGDDDANVLVASNGDGVVAWYENTDGLGLFGPRRIITTLADGAGSAFAADLDDDGDRDVVSASFFNDRIAWYANTGGLGDFGPQQIISTAANGPWQVIGADLDGDGDTDIVSSSLNDDTVAWYENLDLSNDFGPIQVISTAADFARAVAAADVDGDSDLDVLSASELDNEVAWYENTDGTGSFGPQRIISVAAQAAFAVAAADVDGDGDTDALSASALDDKIAWYENLGDDCNANGLPDSCEADCNANGVADGCDVRAGTSEDCNENGSPDECDIAAGSPDCTGNGVPDSCEPDCNGNRLADSCDIQAGTSDDCDVDAVPDECEPDCNGNDVADDCDIAGGASDDCTHNGIPDECEPDCNGNDVADSCDVSTGSSDDCDANAVPDECDLLSGGSDCDGSGSLDACDTVLTFEAHVASLAADFAREVFAADLDRDGDLDLLSASFVDDKIAWYENTDGAGAYGPQRVISELADGADSVVAADLDGDLDPDVLSASQNDDSVAWYENTNGLGGFGPPQVFYAQADGASSVASADLDGDGDLDALSASFNDGRILWYANQDGAGSFSSPRLISDQAAGAFSVFAADVDLDLDADVLSASFTDDKIAWYENLDGTGTFGPQQIISAAAAQAISVFAADLDGDLDPDVLAASFEDDRIAWYENLDGAGAFGPRQVISAGANGASSAVAEDVDGDGDLDVVSGSFFDSRVAWYENLDGAGSFGPPQTIATDGAGLLSVIAADLDGDSDIDVAAASQNDDKIAWYENGSGDCNGNGRPDSCDLPDCSGNGVPDSCEPDCNGNGAADSCDIFFGTSADCDANGLPDECEPDCNGNDVADRCDVSSGASADCDANGYPDDCQPDCNEDGVPDVCDPDCNDNGVADGCDAACRNAGVASLCDTDADSCHDCSGGSFDPDGDGEDSDSDGVCNEGDCKAHNAAIWLPPAPATGLAASRIGVTVTYSWVPPAEPGALSVAYDTVRSDSASNFTSGGVCLEINGTNTNTVDAQQPLPGTGFYYLIRVENGCPASTLGTNSAGAPRVALSCP